MEKKTQIFLSQLFLFDGGKIYINMSGNIDLRRLKYEKKSFPADEMKACAEKISACVIM